MAETQIEVAEEPPAEPADLAGTAAAAEADLYAQFSRQLNAAVEPASTAFLLQQVQEVLLRSESVQRQAADFQIAIFNALPAHVALIGTDGRILAVNEAWRRFAESNGMKDNGRCLGQNYLEMTERVEGAGAAEAQAAARGIRQVLAGEIDHFALEYAAHSPNEKRWFQLMVTPLCKTRHDGAVVMHVDITQRKLADESLRLGEARLRSILDSALDCIIMMDRRGVIIEFNPAAERTFGYERAEVVGRKLAELVLPAAARERHRAGASHPLAAGDDPPLRQLVETNVVRRDGTEFPIELAITRTGGVEEPMFTAYLRDITERKRAEEQIKKLAAFPRLNPCAVLEFAGDGTLTYCNDAAQAMTHSLGESQPMKVLPPGTTEIVTSCLRENQNKLHLETRVGDRAFSWSFFPISASGVVHCYAEEITIRKRAEERILEQAALLDHAQDAISVRDLDHRIVYWNKGSERLFGWSAGEAESKSAIELLFKERTPELQEAQRKVLEEGGWTGELRQVTKTGKEVIVQSRWTLVRDPEGRPKSILVIATDVTEQHRLQRQFLRAQRLESIGTLASGIAHDLNNVLAPMLMSVNLLQETITDGPNAKLLDTLRFSAQRGAEMVRQILVFTRGQEGARGPVNLKHLVNEVAKIAGETFPKGIQIQTHVRKDLWPIQADNTQMHQVMMNLCVNARDAMPTGGLLRIEVENVVVDQPYASLHLEARPGPHLVVTVSDTGTGIAPEILDQIFDPFFSTKAQGHGTGLGLSTVMGIVKSHQGFINTYSEVGKGTRFKVYLPATTSAAASAAAAPPLEMPCGHGERILLIEDELAVQEITKAILKKYGYKVFTAADGTEALATFAQHKNEIDVVMTDIMMPYLDGPATIRALQKIDPSVCVIAASGLLENEVVTRNFRNVTFLLKPFTTETLLITVEAALKEKRKTD